MKVLNPETQNHVKQYFRVKARQLAAMADLPVCEHPGLIGSHREELQRIYLREVLPKRFEVGRGMVYGFGHRSKEADIVIWDSQNYPSLPMLDHSFFFAESVRVVLESKSAWREEEFQDVLEKSRSIRDIITIRGLSLTDEIVLLRQKVAATQTRQVHAGMVIIPHHIGTAAIFLTGGHSLNSASLTDDFIRQIDDSWPDVLLLLEPGRVVIKNYRPIESTPFGGEGWLEFYDLGEDALFAFTVGLLAFLEERSVQIERPLDLTQYVPDLVSIDPTATIDFPLTRPIPQRKHLWDSGPFEGEYCIRRSGD
jgi:hypothetical protein